MHSRDELSQMSVRCVVHVSVVLSLDQTLAPISQCCLRIADRWHAGDRVLDWRDCNSLANILAQFLEAFHHIVTLSDACDDVCMSLVLLFDFPVMKESSLPIAAWRCSVFLTSVESLVVRAGLRAAIWDSTLATMALTSSSSGSSSLRA